MATFVKTICAAKGCGKECFPEFSVFLGRRVYGICKKCWHLAKITRQLVLEENGKKGKKAKKVLDRN